MSHPKASELVACYRKIKAALDAESKAFKERKADLESQMEMIKTKLKAMAEELGVESFKTPDGTAFKAKNDFVSVTDWDEILCFCIAPLFPDLCGSALLERVDQSNLDYLSKGILKTAVKDHLDKHKVLPPGVKYEVKRVMNIRKGPK